MRLTTKNDSCAYALYCTTDRLISQMSTNMERLICKWIHLTAQKMSFMISGPRFSQLICSGEKINNIITLIFVSKYTLFQSINVNQR